MLTSMTGHGQARRDGDGFEILVEVRSVNNRFLRIVSKIPEELSHLQANLEDQLRTRIQRGTVFLTLRLTPTRRTEFFQIDEEVIKSYHARLDALARELGTGEEILVKDLVSLPGAVQTEETLSDSDEFLGCAHNGLEEAVTGLNEMRKREGAHLHDEFKARHELLGKLLARIKNLAADATVEYQQRLEDRVRRLLTNHEINLSPQDLIKEVAVVAERSDISEEISRMDSHLSQFDETLAGDGPAGRKLEFLVQEMFREANTMASKSIHPELNRIVVDYKSELDRLKEQVQNVE